MFVTLAEKFRSDAEEWLNRATLAPVGSWERERLIWAAKLNRALAKKIDHVGQSAGCQSPFSYLSTRRARLRTGMGKIRRDAAETSKPPLEAQGDRRHRTAGSDSRVKSGRAVQYKRGLGPGSQDEPELLSSTKHGKTDP